MSLKETVLSNMDLCEAWNKQVYNVSMNCLFFSYAPLFLSLNSDEQLLVTILSAMEEEAAIAVKSMPK